MFRWFLRNVSALFLSLTLAIIIWIVAVNEQDPFQEKVFPEPVPITVTHVPSGMMIVGDTLAPVDVRVRAPVSVWASLRIDQLHVTADLSNAGSGEVTVQLTGTVDPRDARVTAITPADLRLTLEQVVRRTVPVRLEIAGDPSIGYQAGTPSVSAATAEISGPASIADSVSELVAHINIADTKESINGSVPLQPVNTSGQAVSGISIEPSEVTVKIPVEQLGGYRDVAVKAVIEGQAATGYRITNIVVSPPVVTLFSSDPSLVAGLPGFVETEPLNISQAIDDIEARLSLKLPAGVSLVGEQTVVAQVSVAAIESGLTIQRNLEVQGLGPGMNASPSPAAVDVILSGPLSTLDTLTPEDVRVVVDLLNLPPGIHQVKPEVIVLPEGVTVQTVLPSTVEVLITGRGTPIPTRTP